MRDVTLLQAVDVATFPHWREEWEAVVESSADAWIWHTLRAFIFNISAGGAVGAEDLSFFIVENGRVIGLVPLTIQTRTRAEGGTFREAAFYSGFLPWPCFRSDAVWHSELDTFAFEELERRARTAGASRIVVCLAPPEETGGEESRVETIAERFGFTRSYFDIHSTLVSSAGVAKAMSRYDYKHFSPQFSFTVADKEAVTPELEEVYYMLHTKDAGRSVRARESYTLQADSARSGEAFYISAMHKETGTVAGMTLVFSQKKTAYYGSVAVEPDFRRLCVGYLLQCETLKELLRRGVMRYDLGVKAGPDADAKEVGISRFKEKISRGSFRHYYQVTKELV